MRARGGRDVFLAREQRPGRLGRRGPREAVGDDGLEIVRVEPAGREDLPHGRDDALARVVGMDHRLADGEWQVERAGWRGGDQHDARQSARTARGDKLRDLAAHRVPDQDVPLEVEGRDDGLRIVGEIGQRVAGRRRGRSAPSALIDRDGAEVRRQPIDHVSPGPRRPTPVVQEDQRGRPDALLLHVEFDAVRRDHHDEISLDRWDGPHVAAQIRCRLAGRGPVGRRPGQAVAWRMKPATAAGWDSIGTWLLLTWATVAFIRAAMRSCSARGIA